MKKRKRKSHILIRKKYIYNIIKNLIKLQSNMNPTKSEPIIISKKPFSSNHSTYVSGNGVDKVEIKVESEFEDGNLKVNIKKKTPVEEYFITYKILESENKNNSLAIHEFNNHYIKNVQKVKRIKDQNPLEGLATKNRQNFMKDVNILNYDANGNKTIIPIKNFLEYQYSILRKFNNNIVMLIDGQNLLVNHENKKINKSVFETIHKFEIDGKKPYKIITFHAYPEFIKYIFDDIKWDKMEKEKPEDIKKYPLISIYSNDDDTLYLLNNSYKYNEEIAHLNAGSSSEFRGSYKNKSDKEAFEKQKNTKFEMDDYILNHFAFISGIYGNKSYILSLDNYDWLSIIKCPGHMILPIYKPHIVNIFNLIEVLMDIMNDRYKIMCLSKNSTTGKNMIISRKNRKHGYDNNEYNEYTGSRRLRLTPHCESLAGGSKNKKSNSKCPNQLEKVKTERDKYKRLYLNNMKRQREIRKIRRERMINTGNNLNNAKHSKKTKKKIKKNQKKSKNTKHNRKLKSNV